MTKRPTLTVPPLLFDILLTHPANMPQHTKTPSRGKGGKAKAAAVYRTIRVQQDISQDEDAIFGAVTKVYGNHRYLLTIPDPKDTRPLTQRRLVEVQASAASSVVRRTLRARENPVRVGEYLVVAPSGSDYEIVLMLSRDLVQEYRKSGRLHPNLSVNISAPDECGIEFDYEASAQHIDEEIAARKNHKNKALARGLEAEIPVALPIKGSAAAAPLIAVDGDDGIDIDNI